MGLSVEEQHILDYFKMVHVSFEDDTRRVHEEILSSLGKSNDSGCLEKAISSVNSVIKQFDFEIVDGIDEVSSKKLYCLIKTSNNLMSQKSAFYDKTTTELLSKIIEECLSSENGDTSEIFCLNCSTGLQSNKSSVQLSLQKLITDKWIVSQEGKITLGMRCVLELEQLIKSQYPDYRKCSLCKTFLTQGSRCARCQSLTHFHCFKKFCQIHKLSTESNICPSCKDEGNTSETEDDTNSDTPDPPTKRMRS